MVILEMRFKNSDRRIVGFDAAGDKCFRVALGVSGNDSITGV
jgi:hypothetical protein